MSNQLSIWRREFHQYPELGWFEMRTTSRLAEILESLGYEPKLGESICKKECRMNVPADEFLAEHAEWAMKNGADPKYLDQVKDGCTGVTTEVVCGIGDGSTVALRFDIDAIPVRESEELDHIPVKEGFRSKADGVMHACGHDGHMAIGLGVAAWVMEHKNKLNGKVKFIFQPAEEGVRGGYATAESGVLDDVDYLFAGHIMPGTSGAKAAMIENGGPIGLATTKFDVEYIGKAAHAGANPETGKNAMLAAASAVLNLHAIPRFGTTPTHINVGKLTAGTGRNVVCDRAKLELEVRGETTEANEFMEKRALQIVRAAADMYECEIKIEKMGSAPLLQNSPELMREIKEMLEIEGISVVTAPKSQGMSEDFSHLSAKVLSQGGKSLYIGFPCCCPAGNHHKKFDFDERVLETGVEVYSKILTRVLADWREQ